MKRRLLLGVGALVGLMSCGGVRPVMQDPQHPTSHGVDFQLGTTTTPETVPTTPAGLRPPARSEQPLEVGASAPPVRFNTSSQSIDSATALRSGPLVLVFFIGDFCSYCRRQLTALEGSLRDFRAVGATVWAVSSDGPQAMTQLRRDLNLSFTLAPDPSLSAIGAFGVESRGTGTARPAVFVLAPDGQGGRVVYRHVGADQDDRASLDVVVEAARNAARSASSPTPTRTP